MVTPARGLPDKRTKAARSMPTCPRRHALKGGSLGVVSGTTFKHLDPFPHRDEPS